PGAENWPDLRRPPRERHGVERGLHSAELGSRSRTDSGSDPSAACSASWTEPSRVGGRDEYGSTPMKWRDVGPSSETSSARARRNVAIMSSSMRWCWFRCSSQEATVNVSLYWS